MPLRKAKVRDFLGSKLFKLRLESVGELFSYSQKKVSCHLPEEREVEKNRVFSILGPIFSYKIESW